MATSANGELLALSALRNPYPGKLGVVEQGALADLLIVDGNPLENINLVADPANKFLIIMKDGVIWCGRERYYSNRSAAMGSRQDARYAG